MWDSHPAGRAEGLPPVMFCSSGYVVPQRKVAMLQNTVTAPLRGDPSRSQPPPTRTGSCSESPSTKPVASPAGSRRKRRHSSPQVQQAALSWVHFGHSQHPQANSPVCPACSSSGSSTSSPAASAGSRSVGSLAEGQRPAGSSSPTPKKAQLLRPGSGRSPGTNQACQRRKVNDAH